MIEIIQASWKVNDWGQVIEVPSHKVDTKSKDYLEAKEILE